MRRLKKLLPKRWWQVGAILLVVLIAVIIGLRIWYNQNLAPVNKNDKQTVYYTIESGSGLHEISLGLKKAGLIRNTSVFEYYVRTHELYGSLQAGSYSFNRSMSAPQIVKKIVNGEISTNLLTILPGKRLDHIKKAFLDAGYSEQQIKTAFDPASYGGLPVLASLPPGATLEGYLYPDSFQKDGTTPATTIVKQSLNELDKYLTADILEGFKQQGLTTYQGIILASIVYQESGDPKYEPTIAQVFLTRLKQNMALQSDPTANYGADIAGAPRSNSFDSAFNTYLHPGLPPGPIGNFTHEALEAVARPATSDFLYFVADDACFERDKNCVVHFTKTQAEHEAAVAKYCAKHCGR